MSRQIVRQMKRTVAAADRPGASTDALVLARASALSLLSRSIAFHHGRLAIIRLATAVRAGADIPPEHWVYCREAAACAKDTALRALFLGAAQAASRHPSNATQSH
jgi:hypothetical protein